MSGYASIPASRESCLRILKTLGQPAMRKRIGASGMAVFSLSSGNITAQVILILVAPVLTRIYSPEAFGIYAGFLALAALLVVVACGGYDQAILLPRDEGDAVTVVILSLLLAGVTVLLTAVGSILAVTLLNQDGRDYVWLLWLGPMVLVQSGTGVLVNFAIWHGRYGLVARSLAFKSFAIGLFQVVMGMRTPDAGVLIAGSVVGAIVANLRMLQLARASWDRHRRSASLLVKALKDYAAFPTRTLPANMLFTLTVNGLTIFVGLLYGSTVLGLWVLAARIVGAPLNMVGTSIAQVYYRRAIEVRTQGGSDFELLRRVMMRSAGLSLPVFLLLGATAPWLITFVFGDAWSTAGTYLQVMLIWMWLQFIASPASRAILVIGRNSLGLWSQGALTAVACCVSTAAVYFDWDFLSYLWILSTLMACAYGASIAVFARAVKRTG